MPVHPAPPKRSSFTVKRPWELAYSQKFRARVAQNPRILKRVYILIIRNLPELDSNKTVVEKGIKISKEATGSYKGSTRALTLKVVVDKNSYFVKVFEPIYSIEAQERIRRIEKLENFLAKHNNKFGDLNLKVVKPSFFSNPVNSSQNYSFMVTPYYGKREVIQVNDVLKNHEKYAQIHAALAWLQESIKDNAVTKGINAKNAFYRRRTNTLLLFDI